MTLADIPLHPTTRALRQFAAAWLVFFLAFGVHQYLVREHLTLGVVVMALALGVGLLGLIKPPPCAGFLSAGWWSPSPSAG